MLLVIAIVQLWGYFLGRSHATTRKPKGGNAEDASVIDTTLDKFKSYVGMAFPQDQAAPAAQAPSYDPTAYAPRRGPSRFRPNVEETSADFGQPSVHLSVVQDKTNPYWEQYGAAMRKSARFGAAR